MTYCLQDIPECIFFYMQDWLQTKTKDYVAYGRNNMKSSLYDDKYWRNFMNTSKVLMATKKRTIYLKLNGKYSKRYVEDPVFRQNVLARIGNSYVQLALDLVNFKVVDNHFLENANNCHCVDLSFSSIMSIIPLQNIRYLLLSECEILNLSPTVLPSGFKIQGIESIDLSFCKHLRTSVTDVLSSIKYVDLSYCHEIEDVSFLSYCHTLKLRGCKKVSSVSTLGGLYELDIGECELVRDISNLGNLHTLNLSKCYKVKDLSALINVKELDLSGHLETDFSSLRNVQKLKLTDNKLLTDLSCLSEHLRELHAHNCPLIPDLSSLINLEVLSFGFSHMYQARTLEVLDIEKLTKLRKLTVGSLIGIKGIEQLTNLQVVDCMPSSFFSSSTVATSLLQTAFQFSTLSMTIHEGEPYWEPFQNFLMAVPELSFMDWHIAMTLNFPNLRKLSLFNCEGFKTLPIYHPFNMYQLFSVMIFRKFSFHHFLL
jgi:Leucine-rich repeat (LRR) protein